MDTQPPTTDERVAALEAQMVIMQTMVARLTAALIDTAKKTGYRPRHVKLAVEALRNGFLDAIDFDY
jgi:hypothetical protein